MKCAPWEELYIKFTIIHLDFVKIQEIFSLPHKDMSNMECFVRISRGPWLLLLHALCCLARTLALPGCHLGRKWKKGITTTISWRNLHIWAPKLKRHQCTVPPSLHTGKVNHHHKNKDGLAKLQTLAWPRWCWRGHKRTWSSWLKG